MAFYCARAKATAVAFYCASPQTLKTLQNPPKTSKTLQNPPKPSKTLQTLSPTATQGSLGARAVGTVPRGKGWWLAVQKTRTAAGSDLGVTKRQRWEVAKVVD